MKIGIHPTEGLYSDLWIPYCESHGIEYKLVDCYRSDIIEQLEDCDALMWHFSHKSARASKFAKDLLYAVQASGKEVFPDFNMLWHFDDKIGQKYLFETKGIPHPPTYVWYNRKEALHWASVTEFPKVFKLRNGSASDNVKLVRTRKHAKRLIRRAFTRGFRQYHGWSNLKDRVRKYRLGKATIRDVLKGIVRIFWTTEYARHTAREKGYVYFQDFVPGLDHDFRVFVIGDRAFFIKRMVRKNDFRASGSGTYLGAREYVREDLVRLAFEISDLLKSPCLVFDFVYLEGKPVVLEISFGTITNWSHSDGYLDREMHWHEGLFDFGGTMVEWVLSHIKDKSA